MNERRSSAAYRIALVYAAVYAFTIAALGLAVYFAADGAISRQQEAGISAETAELIADFRRRGLNDLRMTVDTREAGGGSNNFGYLLVARDGRRLAGRLPLEPAAPGWHRIVMTAADGGTEPGRLLATRLDGGARLGVALDNRSVDLVDRTILELALAAVALAVIVGAVGALLLGSYLRQRLEAVVATAQAIAGGDFGSRVPLSARGDEFDRLGRALNAMLDQIVQLLENLRQVSSDVAHDLRTPLARLRVEIELARSGAKDTASQHEALDRALHQSDELLRLFSAILRISEVEGGSLARSFVPVDISALVEDLSESYAPAVADGGRALMQQVTPRLSVLGDRQLIAQALINLLDNAQRHTPEGTTITIIARRAAAGVVLIVADDGPGVPAADRERVVRRFVRLDASRSTSGHGLGLNLVVAIASAHRGTLTLGDNAPGLRVTLWLPAIG